jgi:hypothetical protein
VFGFFNKLKLTKVKENFFCAIFTRFEGFPLTKDVGKVPYHMYKGHDYDSFIVTYKNYYISMVIVLKLFFIPKISFSTILFLIINTKQIKVLNLFHTHVYNLIYIYKLFNKDGMVYIKGDLSARGLKVDKLFANYLIKKYLL